MFFDFIDFWKFFVNFVFRKLMIYFCFNMFLIICRKNCSFRWLFFQIFFCAFASHFLFCFLIFWRRFCIFFFKNVFDSKLFIAIKSTFSNLSMRKMWNRKCFWWMIFTFLNHKTIAQIKTLFNDSKFWILLCFLFLFQILFFLIQISILFFQ